MKIILGITGGIAAYKSCELLRLFKKDGHEVRVVMTKNAEKFVSALTFHSLSGEPVLRSLHNHEYDLSATSHIDLAKWGDILIIAPATANFIAKFSYGIADDALLTEALAFQGAVLLAPAMNTRMWDAEVTKENISRLKKRGIHFAEPAIGELACGEMGTGKMLEPSEIFQMAQKLLAKDLPLKGKKILITNGPTRSYIDRVRFLTNKSSGKMGHAIAVSAENMGADVTLISGPVASEFLKLKHGKVITVETGEEMLEACLPFLPYADYVFATAAVADFKMPSVLEGKLRREGNLVLELESSVDVLAELGKRKKPGQFFFGFAAEAGEGDAEFAKAREKMARKNLDMLALNNISRKDIGFDADENEVYLFDRKDSPRKFIKNTKQKLADLLLIEAKQGASLL